MKFSAATIAALAPAACYAGAGGTVGNGWSFPNSPTGGLKDITFPMNVAKAPHATQFYFAQQFNFGGDTGAMGYTGLQPAADADGRAQIRAVFSSFTKGTTTDDANCSGGADGGAGVSCGHVFNGTYADTLHLVVENVSGTLWKGTVVDTVTGGSAHIGSWTLPAGTTGLSSSQLGFVEDFVGEETCADLPKSAVTFYNPFTTTAGAGAGNISEPYQYGVCKDQAGVVLTPVTGGWNIALGFK